ncbi:hypothetical protein NC653_032458 [Populus alba x Populus x berolinensis]|uniref:Uncharacterized protein n=1 Tax=Populus alba x Populus x berolinensis TaxID=444605 RepID=A0AAD6PXZ8_9ROSI|nr:hypothetical protein NC653_032458 [Populus alba x Populus x berolinensis]
MENPNPILQNQEREICQLKRKKKGGKASTSTTLAPQYFPAAHPYKVAREKQKQTLLPATINQSFSCSRATLSEHSRERASKILRDLERESMLDAVRFGGLSAEGSIHVILLIS